MKFGVFTLGCKVNQYESNAIISVLQGLGHEATSEFCPADVYVINTCSITSEADKKSRQMIARAQKHNPYAKIVILGCSSENNPDSYNQKQNVVAVYGTKDKTEAIIGFVKQLEEEYRSIGSNLPLSSDTSEKTSILDETVAKESDTRARAYLKVQDGCNNFCSYCIVPYLRGRSRSIPIEMIVDEAKELALCTEEIVITGINISAFSDEGKSLQDLIIALKDVPVRKRLGSLECGVITIDFLESMRDSGFCDHFHLSLQSGSKNVLSAMNRRYTPEEFFGKIKLIRSVFPFAGITTDIITAFPTESEQNHRETLDFAKSAEFSDIHIFQYSRRQGTKAASMPLIEKSISERRASELNHLKLQLKTEFYKKNLGRNLRVFIEDSEENYNVGYTSNYIKVFSNAPRHSFLCHRLGQIYNINGIKGDVVDG